jgi:hypothetical protein
MTVTSVTAVVRVHRAPTMTTAQAEANLPVRVSREPFTRTSTAATVKQDNAAAAVQWTAAHLDADSAMRADLVLAEHVRRDRPSLEIVRAQLRGGGVGRRQSRVRLLPVLPREGIPSRRKSVGHHGRPSILSLDRSRRKPSLRQTGGMKPAYRPTRSRAVGQLSPLRSPRLCARSCAPTRVPFGSSVPGGWAGGERGPATPIARRVMATGLKERSRPV